MAAFDRVPSGIDGLDEVLDSIRLGDNVVWQVSSLDEFRPHCRRLCRPLGGRRQKRCLPALCLSQTDKSPQHLQRCRGRSRPQEGLRDLHHAGARRDHARGPRDVLRVRQPVRPAQVCVVRRPHHGELLPPHLPVPVLARHGGVLPHHQGRPLLCGHRKDSRHDAAPH